MPSTKNVERHLWRTTEKMLAAESSLRTLCKLRDNGIGTNDIMNFASKQAELRVSNNNIDRRLLRSAMRGKINDARVTLNRLRHTRNQVKHQLLKEYESKTNKVKKIISKMQDQAKAVRLNYKNNEKEKST